jgi:hypothetical protein
MPFLIGEILLNLMEFFDNILYNYMKYEYGDDYFEK